MNKPIEKESKFLPYLLNTVLGFVLVALSFDIVMVTLLLTNNEETIRKTFNYISSLI